MGFRWILGLCVLVGSASARHAEDGAISQFRRDLLRLGYENVALETTDSTLVVWCENRRIRYPVVWMVEALSLAASSVPREHRVCVVAERFARPVVSLAARASDVVAWMEGAVPTSAFRDRLTVAFAGDRQPPGRLNPSLRRVDLMLGPGRLLTELGLPGDWIRATFDVSAELTTALAPGLIAYGRMFVPLHHRGGPVDNEERYNEVRPGSFLLSYFHSLGPSAFSTVTMGMFELRNWQYDSYGVMVDLFHATPDGHWVIGGAIGYLGSATYRVLDDRPERYRVWEIVWPPKDWPYQAVIGYRFDGFDLHVTARWGRFLAKDRAWQLDVERKFGEVSVTIFGIKSDDRVGGADPVDRNNVRLLGGIRMQVPLYPRERSMPSRLRVTSAASYVWTYRYRAGHVGVNVESGHRVEDIIEYYNPTYIRNNLERARTQIRASRLQEGRGRREVTTSANAADGSH